jgi:hypothetical protein
MERNPTSEPNIHDDLARLKDLADSLLHKDNDDPNLKSGFYGWFFTRKKEGVYSLVFGQERQHILEFTEDNTLLAAEIYWTEGRLEYYAHEYEPVIRWRFEKWRRDYERQLAEGMEVLRFGDEHYAEYRRLIGPQDQPAFVRSYLQQVERELSEEPDPGISFNEGNIPGTMADILDERDTMRYLYEGGRGSINRLPEEWPDEED